MRVQESNDQAELRQTLGQILNEASDRLEAVRRDQLRQYSDFFSSLSHRVATAHRVERELDRLLARRFNVLDYLSTDELGLSRIIADLLDPSGTHGQSTLFLERLFTLLSENLDSWGRLALDDSSISVEAEKEIAEQRRIDVFVQVVGRKSVHVMGIENKPYADDQNRQVFDYLHYLRDRFIDHFLLIYLSPQGEGPTGQSIPLQELKDNWTERFRILSYAGVSEALQDDQFRQFRISQFSLVDWLQACRRDCEVDRLRWFLGDIADFCQREFGR